MNELIQGDMSHIFADHIQVKLQGLLIFNRKIDIFIKKDQIYVCLESRSQIYILLRLEQTFSLVGSTFYFN